MKSQLSTGFTTERLVSLRTCRRIGLPTIGIKRSAGGAPRQSCSPAFRNCGRVPVDERFPSTALVVCPNLTIKERLQVLRPDNQDGSYHDAFDHVPSQRRPLLNAGKVLVTNQPGLRHQVLYRSVGHTVLPAGQRIHRGLALAMAGERFWVGRCH
jgi:hypothetical protein